MPKPERPTGDPKVVDLKARRRVAELQKQARKTARPTGRPRTFGPLLAWAVLLLVALLLATVRWLLA